MNRDVLDWRTGALCAQTDLDLFFPEKGGQAAPAKRLCAACPVREACLAVALEHRELGVWGGTTEAERARMRRPKAAA